MSDLISSTECEVFQHSEIGLRPQEKKLISIREELNRWAEWWAEEGGEGEGVVGR